MSYKEEEILKKKSWGAGKLEVDKEEIWSM